MKLSELSFGILLLFSFSACVSQQPDAETECYATEYVNPLLVLISQEILIPERRPRSVWCS